MVMELRSGGKWGELGNMWEEGERGWLGKIVVLEGGEVKHEELLEIKTDVFRLIHISQEEGVNMTVNSVHPGLIMTNLMRHSMLVMMITPFSQRLPSTNFPWRSCNFVSEFSDIFDLEHVKKVSENDVQIVSSLPSTRVMTRPLEEKRTPLHATP
ncbi:hypothetical protein ACH5RR_033909 [Cinchona calisaya]|uniref:Uncharacterized protein n=1 Tax=Cinchona calisaya TaxID=153742 RepID=A0ABD2YAP4_9GENT